MKQFRRINTEDYDLSRVQDSIEEVLSPLSVLPLLDGVLLEGVYLGSSASGNEVKHLLGRKPRFWIVLKKNAQADIWQISSVLESKILTLKASAPVTVSLWVG
jgi:hypothetical protein